MGSTITSIAHGGARRTQDFHSLLSAEARESVKVEANAWIKRLRLVDYGGRTMRQRFTYRGDSLWWFTEIYLHKTRVFERVIETIYALEAAVAEGSSGLLITSTDPVVHQTAQAFGTVCRVNVQSEGSERASAQRDRLLGFAVGPAALLSRLRRRPRTPRAHPKVAAFVHSAFWNDESSHSSGGRESYVGPVLDVLAKRVGPDQLVSVGLGPRRNFRTRRWWDPLVRGHAGRVVIPIEQLAPRQSLREALDLWRNRAALADAIVSGPDIRAAAEWRGYDLWPVVSTALRRAADVQWPWSARSMDESRAALAHLRPGVVVTYAEAGGWGRALILEARRSGIPSVGLQHGFIYRHWLNYQHEADEMLTDGRDSGFPRPDATLVFDGFAANTLISRGRFPDEAVKVTGSPRLDELALQAGVTADRRRALRQSLGVDDEARLLVVAAKYLEIGAELPPVVAAVESIAGVRCVIKPHPAETPELYGPALHGSRRTTLAPSSLDLGSLLSAADAVLTMNSTAAIDAMALKIPSIVVGLPNNLTPFVDAGVMAGAGPDRIRAVMEGVLYDRTVRRELVERGQRFVELYDMRPGGQAAVRAAETVLNQSRRDKLDSRRAEEPT